MMRCRLFAALLMVLPALPPASAAQSGTAGRAFVQGALAGLPGLGAQTGYVGARSFLTTEALFYAGVTPILGSGERTLKVSLGLGGALRPLGVIRTIGGTDYAFDVDLGLRFGPSLLFTTDPTRSSKNQQFSLFLDPFVRVVVRTRRGRLAFAEVGPLRPSVRAGLWFDL